MTISIVIPTFNEAQNISRLLQFLQQHRSADVAEILVADGGSTDNTKQLAENEGAKVVDCPKKGRAPQMNYAALQCSGDVLYFVHADTFPAPGFASDICDAVAAGYDLGRYRTRFLSDKWLLRMNEWFTRFDLFIGMGGDQTLFIKKILFRELNGFNENMILMEDFELCHRAREKGKYTIMKGDALVSARKYEKNSWLNVQLANYKVVSLYKKGAPQEKMVEEYKKRLNW